MRKENSEAFNHPVHRHYTINKQQQLEFGFWSCSSALNNTEREMMEQFELRSINFITPKLPFLFSEEEGGDAKVVKAGLGTDLLLPIRTRLKKCKTRESTGCP